MISFSDGRVSNVNPHPEPGTLDVPDLPGTEEVPYRQPAPKGTPQTGDPPNEMPPMKDPTPEAPSPNRPIPISPIDASTH